MWQLKRKGDLAGEFETKQQAIDHAFIQGWVHWKNVRSQPNYAKPGEEFELNQDVTITESRAPTKLSFRENRIRTRRI